MKRSLFFALCLCAATCVFSQEEEQVPQLAGLSVVEVLGSDDFESITPWQNFDTEGLDLKLNNALGGTQEYEWSPLWGGACVHEKKSAVSGNQCMQLHWGGTVVLQGFYIDPDKTYQIEVMVHPQGGVSGEWNNWAALHLFVFDSSNIWQTQGVRIRLSNNDPVGSSPSLLALDVWEGEDGTERPVNLFSFPEEVAKYTIADAADETAQNFWIPLKVVFKGEGSVEKPLIMDFYLNDIFVATQTFDNIYWLGDMMIGLQNGSDNEDLTRYDNVKVSELGEGSAVRMTEADEFAVMQTGDNTLRVVSDVYGDKVEYKLFTVSGLVAVQGSLAANVTDIHAEQLSAGVYLLQVKDNTGSYVKTVRTFVK